VARKASVAAASESVQRPRCPLEFVAEVFLDALPLSFEKNSFPSFSSVSVLFPFFLFLFLSKCFLLFHLFTF